MNVLGKRIHLMGIGGTGVGALAALLRRRGAEVDGCDAAESSALAGLRAQGVACTVGHHASHVARADIVVHTAAIASTHPELAAARRRGAMIVSRGVFLAQLMAGTPTIAITGSHGKTTTTWFCGQLLAAAGCDPTVVVGGTIASLQGNVRCGSGDLFVAEADESDGSFARIAPRVAVVTNLDHEHLRHYGSFAALVSAMNEWLCTVPNHGLIVVPADGFPAAALHGVSAPVTTCGIDRGDWRLRELTLLAESSRAVVEHHEAPAGELRVGIPGVHMALNALMALAAARALAAQADPRVLEHGERVRRRFTVHGLPNGVRVVEDYGHHPAEVRATIAAARLAGGRVHVLFQPHRFTRTVDCWDEFVAAFDQAAAVVVAPIYGAGESPIASCDHRQLVTAIIARRGGLDDAPVLAVDDPTAALPIMGAVARAGDTCLILGAGDVGAVAPGLCAYLERQGALHP